MQLVVICTVFLELDVRRILIFARLHLLDPNDVVGDGRYFAWQRIQLLGCQRVGNLVSCVLGGERVHFLVGVVLDILVY